MIGVHTWMVALLCLWFITPSYDLKRLYKHKTFRDILNTINYWIIDILNQIRLCSTSWFSNAENYLTLYTTWHLVLPKPKSFCSKHLIEFGIKMYKYPLGSKLVWPGMFIKMWYDRTYISIFDRCISHAHRHDTCDIIYMYIF